MQDIITLDYGSGGLKTAQLIDEIGKPELFVISDSVPAEREEDLRSFAASFRR